MRTRKTLRTPISVLAATLFCAAAWSGVTPTGLAHAHRWSRSKITAHLQNTAPDAGRIAFAADREIYLINPDGSGLTQITYSAPDVYNYQPAISPDGTRIAFATVQGSQAGISIIYVDGSGLLTLTTNNLTRDSEPAWSPDGSKLAFVRGYDPTSEGVANFSPCGPIRIYLLDLETGGLTNLTPDQDATDPSWSPDGTRIAFASNKDGNFDIYSMASDGTDVQQLTRTTAHEAEPAWSPDGKTIAYASGYARADLDCGFIHTGRGDWPVLGTPDIHLMSNDGTNQIRLTETENNLEPTWSPDGASLAFVNFHRDSYGIAVLDAYHKTPFWITSDSAFKSSPSWSRSDPRAPTK
jgi:Tol biopolymer transport system component